MLEKVSDHGSPLVRRLDEGVRAELFVKRGAKVRRPTVAPSVRLMRTAAALRSSDWNPL